MIAAYISTGIAILCFCYAAHFYCENTNLQDLLNTSCKQRERATEAWMDEKQRVGQLEFAMKARENDNYRSMCRRKELLEHIEGMHQAIRFKAEDLKIRDRCNMRHVQEAIQSLSGVDLDALRNPG